MRSGTLLVFVVVLVWMGKTSVPDEASAQQRTLGPVLKIYTDPFDFDTVRCRIRRCIPLTFHNIGDTALVLYNHDRLRRPFFVRIDTPLVLQPGEMATFDLCYNPSLYTSDSQYVFFRADTRLPLSIAMVHDVSSSMYTMMPDGKRRYEAAHEASSEFIGNLLDTLGVEDEGAIYTYDYYQDFELRQWWTKDTAALRAAIPGRPLGTATCTFDAIARVIDSMKTRTKKRILIMITDGEDSGNVTCGPATEEIVIKKAQDNDVRIYAISIGNVNREPLIRIVKATGGKEFNATQSTDLLAIYREIAVDMSKNVELDIFMKGEAVGPKVEFIPPSWTFDSVQVGETACQEILLRNNGNAWLAPDTVRKIFSSPYSITGIDVDSIAPYQTISVRICFTPLVPLHYEVPIPYFPSPCEFFSDTLHATGSSFLLPRVPRKKPLLTSTGDLAQGFDTTFCRTTECATLELRNVSDTSVTVHSMLPVSPPFSATVTAPFTIGPGDAKSITVCYYPPDAPRTDTLDLSFTADARVPQRIALLFDGSVSMRSEYMPGLTRMLASSAGANDFLDGLIFDSSVTDRVAVAVFDTVGSTQWDGRFVTSKDSARSLLPDSTADQIACLYAAVDGMLDNFSVASTEPQSLILFTAGEDAGAAHCGSITDADIVTRAVSLGVRIHCVQLGDADSSSLRTIAQGSGGRYLRPVTLLDLILGLREIELDLSRNVQFRSRIIAQGVTPILQVDDDALEFETYIYQSDAQAPHMREQTVKNVGDAPMHLQLTGLEAPFIERSGPPRARGETKMLVDTVIDPGQSLLLEHLFHPAVAGFYTDTLYLTHDGCGQDPIEIPMSGRCIASDLNPWEYPLAVNPLDPLRFDTLSCGGEQCLNLWFATPDSATMLRFLEELPAPFHAVGLDSLEVSSDQDVAVEVCYRPRLSGDHQAWLHFESDFKPPFSTVFLQATDSSTFTDLDEGLHARQLMREARRRYADWIQPMPFGDDDEAAIMRFDDRGTDVVVNYSSNYPDIIFTEPDSLKTGPGDLAAAMNDAIDYAVANADGKRIVIAMVNESTGLSAADAAALKTRAEQEDVILAVAALGRNGYDLLENDTPLAAAFDSCYTLQALQSFVYESTRLAIESKRDSVQLTGVSLAPRLEARPHRLSFDSVRVGERSCRNFTLTNKGNAPLELLRIISSFGPDPQLPQRTLLPGDSIHVELCFTPTHLDCCSGDVIIVYDGCGTDTLVYRTDGFGYDSLMVGIADTVRGMPGSVVRIPVRLYGRIPASYEVDFYKLSISYNRTMLYPLKENILDGSISQEHFTAQMNPEFDDTSATALVTYWGFGSAPLDSETDVSILLQPPFLVLHGDAMMTPLRVESVTLNEEPRGQPVVTIGPAGVFIADSLGFHQQRLIDASERYLAKVIGTYPNPFNSSVTIAYQLREVAALRLRVFDALGRQVAELENGVRAAGTHRVRFDAQGLPTGMYFYHLESGGVVLSGSMLHLK